MFYEFSLTSTRKQTLMQTTESTVEKETVPIIADKQAPLTQKQKSVDHINEELRLEISKTLKLPQLSFFLLC